MTRSRSAAENIVRRIADLDCMWGTCVDAVRGEAVCESCSARMYLKEPTRQTGFKSIPFTEEEWQNAVLPSIEKAAAEYGRSDVTPTKCVVLVMGRYLLGDL